MRNYLCDVAICNREKHCIPCLWRWSALILIWSVLCFPFNRLIFVLWIFDNTEINVVPPKSGLKLKLVVTEIFQVEFFCIFLKPVGRRQLTAPRLSCQNVENDGLQVLYDDEEGRNLRAESRIEFRQEGKEERSREEGHRFHDCRQGRQVRRNFVWWPGDWRINHDNNNNKNNGSVSLG